MARSFSFGEARKLVKNHQDLRRKIAEVESDKERYKAEVLSAIEKYVKADVLKYMEEIPVEEINRDKKGIRVKTLRECGINTYADVIKASAQKLAAINGISDDGASVIKDIVNEAAAMAAKTTKIKLNADNVTPETSKLVLTLLRFQKAKSIVDNGQRIIKERENDIVTSEDDVTKSAGLFKWMFTSSEKKQKVTESYQLLSEKLEGEYGDKLRHLIDERIHIGRTTQSEAWSEFKKDPIKFINSLEEISPGIVEDQNGVYGLPEDLAEEVSQELFLPAGLKCTLRKYQEWGVKYILHQEKVLLGDEMGLGKTVQAIAAMVSLYNSGSTHFVVLCPASVIINWCREIEKFSTLKAIKVHGQTREQELNKWIEFGGVAVTTYETTGYFKLPKEFKFSMLVVDEAHYIKNPEAARSVNAEKLCQHAERILFMTGTALENKVDEMVNLVKLLNPSIAYQIGHMKVLATAPQFKEKVAPVYYRRKREDVLTELPELLDNKEWCELGEEEEKLYEETIREKSFNGARRVSWNVDDLSKSCKARRMMEIIEDAKEDGRKIIVFSFFLDTIKKIKALLGDQCTEPINGSVSPARRQEIIDEFNNSPAGHVLAAQIIAGGTGLNIQAASVVILCEPQLKPSIENQAIARAYRMGQSRNVLVYRLLCADTIDEKIMDLLTEKQTVFDAFADDSVAAENVEIDTNAAGNIMAEEMERISKKTE